ncbi:hypothetical protein WICPIJ_005007 [Wickerhamomyces pijperi]|uniref:Uncharacterized protein n=1 Tax=Wickerhamomyces pijperi TaxID=599730 RepID=A0A9P8TMD7_WICPI|nr:hypothetical protein WICPIJ_005007 [Wickerhamomyces pijperi]
MMIVFGPNLTKAGSQPLNMNKGPSFLNEFLIMDKTGSWWVLFIIRVFKTSTGEQIVVAIRPDKMEERKKRLLDFSENWKCATSEDLIKSYETT